MLLSIDTPKMEMGGRHRILKQRQQDMDFPISWIKTYGKGRVFASTMGHAPEVFQNPPCCSISWRVSSSRWAT